jgi:hypothetical protein
MACGTQITPSVSVAMACDTQITPSVSVVEACGTVITPGDIFGSSCVTRRRSSMASAVQPAHSGGVAWIARDSSLTMMPMVPESKSAVKRCWARLSASSTRS